MDIGRADSFEISRCFLFAVAEAITPATPDPVHFNPPSHCPERLQGRQNEQNGSHLVVDFAAFTIIRKVAEVFYEALYDLTGCRWLPNRTGQLTASYYVLWYRSYEGFRYLPRFECMHYVLLRE
jgi:hypothetical protein